ncbi:RNA dependent RNA polymerase-domain-containing protein [Mycena belliarum]|uniref:RNA-dependent RNA polymerase n=1 Tax=Mycena belliarum TaxID=1033014 RepID=A0AAD6UEN8_9AGAR|nr:RNA dependent RNA polymerase-domain-containing protein [Mycena belliae]
MYNKSTIAKRRVPFVRVLVDLSTSTGRVVSFSDYSVCESRATRLVGDSRRFMTVAFTKSSRDQHLKTWLENLTGPGQVIELGEARYTFLGFTEGNLKAGHVLFFREGDDFTVQKLKERFGDLKPVYDASGYGKYAARLGLSFSSTVTTKEILLEDRILLEDLKAADGVLTSDGCGLIRASYAAGIAPMLGVPSDTAVFQIRLGGIKGTLTLCPDEVFDALCGCTGKKIAYRRSMLKYNDGPRILEVQNVSKPPKTARLNKQFILLLLTRGIPISVFEELLEAQLSEIEKITTHREKALECIDGELDAEGDAFHQELYEMLLAGHDMNEPYLATLLLRFQNASREGLRNKLNISVKGSGYLFGVVDHCGVLKEGEVYINLPNKGGPQVGPLVAMRNPAHDPDSVRVLEAVNRPELKHLTNCIVFAATGSYSEPDKMGGGDLDGDMYFVVFNPALIPKKRRTRRAAAATAPATLTKIAIGGRTQTISRSGVQTNTDMRKDAIKTFVSPMRCNFLLGSLSNEWMKHVGATPALADSALCKALVPMIEAALDVVKSGGNMAILRNDYDRLKNSSGSAQQCPPGWENPLEVLAGLVPPSVSTEAAELVCDPELVLRSDTSVDEWDPHVHEAEKLMRTYNMSLRLAIEADEQAKERGLMEEEKRADIMKAEFMAKHFPPVENMLVDVPKYLLKASAWYFTGYKHKKQSFAWLGARWLNYIKASRTGYVPIAVGAQSRPLVGAAMPRSPSTPSRVRVATQEPTPVSLSRPRRRIPALHTVLPPIVPPAGFDSEKEEEADSDIETEFEVIERESAYDTAMEDLVPAAARLRINTTPVPRPIQREDSDDTLVDAVPAPRMSIPRAPSSPVSPSPDVTPRLRTCAQARARIAAALPAPNRSDANVTVPRPRTRGQVRAEAARTRSPEPPRTRTRTRAVSPPTPRSGHTHTFLIQGPRAKRVCKCGMYWSGA